MLKSEGFSELPPASLSKDGPSFQHRHVPHMGSKYTRADLAGGVLEESSLRVLVQES